MKKLLSVSIIALSLLYSCKSAPDSDQAVVEEAQKVEAVSTEATELTVNTEASLIEWVGTKVTGRHNGTLNISEGSLAVQNGTLVGGNFTIDMNSLMATDPGMDAKQNGNLTGHLKSADFFDVETYPSAKFEITAINDAPQAVEEDETNTEEIDQYRVTDPSHSITGNLTMKGVTKSITFPAKVEITDSGVNSMAKFNINRQDWGVAYTGKKDDIISDNVYLGIGITTSK